MKGLRLLLEELTQRKRITPKLALDTRQETTFIDVGYFNTDYQNMFGSCTASGGALGECEIGDSFNAGEAKISGLELVAETIVESSGNDVPAKAELHIYRC